MNNKRINFKENNILVRTKIDDIYLSEMNRYDKIEDENELNELIIAAQGGNINARNKAVTANLGLAYSIAKAYMGMDKFNDILQNANYGLVTAIETFDVSRGTKFSTWALEYIRKYIGEGLTNESRVVRQSAHHVREKRNYIATSFDAPIGSEEGEEKTLLDFMPSSASADNFSKVEDMRVKINYLMKGLKDIEKEVICGLFGLGCREFTQNELSMKFNLTTERIRQIKFEALAKMKEMA